MESVVRERVKEEFTSSFGGRTTLCNNDDDECFLNVVIWI